jgi:hypothetical protein
MAAVARSRAVARGGRDSPDAIEMQLTGGSYAGGAAAHTQLADDEFSDFVSAEDAPGAIIALLSPACSSAFDALCFPFRCRCWRPVSFSTRIRCHPS